MMLFLQVLEKVRVVVIVMDVQLMSVKRGKQSVIPRNWTRTTVRVAQKSRMVRTVAYLMEKNVDR